MLRVRYIHTMVRVRLIHTMVRVRVIPTMIRVRDIHTNNKQFSCYDHSSVLRPGNS